MLCRPRIRMQLTRFVVSRINASKTSKTWPRECDRIEARACDVWEPGSGSSPQDDWFLKRRAVMTLTMRDVGVDADNNDYSTVVSTSNLFLERRAHTVHKGFGWDSALSFANTHQQGSTGRG